MKQPQQVIVFQFFSEEFNRDIYRVCIGELIPESASRIEEKESGISKRYDRYVGSVGFIDGYSRMQNVLVELPNGVERAELKDVLAITNLGVEPEYRGKRMSDLLVCAFESLARKLGKQAVATNSMNQASRRVHRRTGYKVYDRGNSAVKFIN